jgi:homoserine kinase
LHEQYRASAVPDLEAVSTALIDAGALGAALSGAGPTVIGLVGGDTEPEALAAAEAVARRASATIGSTSGRREPLALPVDVRGAQVIVDCC